MTIIHGTRRGKPSRLSEIAPNPLMGESGLLLPLEVRRKRLNQQFLDYVGNSQVASCQLYWKLAGLNFAWAL